MRTKVGSVASIKDRALFSPVRHSLAQKSSSLEDALLPAAHCPPRTDDGVILIGLLWILTVLAVICLSFSKESFVEMSAARNAQSMVGSYYAARAGIAITTFQLFEKRLAASQTNAQTTQTTTTVDPLDLGVTTGTYGGASYQVNFKDESGKINVNAANAQQLILLAEATGIGENEANIISDSILDWRDSDKNARTNGAEDDYYQALTPAYKAKNANLETIEELLLIRGITTDYFYGHSQRDENGSIVNMYGLSHYLTAQPVLATKSQINVNFADIPVLLSTGMDEGTAKAIYDWRKTQPFKNISDLTSIAPSISTAASSFTTASSNLYTFTALAQAANSKARRIIRAVIYLNASQGKQYQTLYWNENVPDYEGNTEGNTQ
jgi:general secretion pathway protein K